MNSHQRMAMDDVGIIGLLSLFLWIMAFDPFRPGVLLFAVLTSAFVGLRLWHSIKWRDLPDEIEEDDDG